MGCPPEEQQRQGCHWSGSVADREVGAILGAEVPLGGDTGRGLAPSRPRHAPCGQAAASTVEARHRVSRRCRAVETFVPHLGYRPTSDLGTNAAIANRRAESRAPRRLGARARGRPATSDEPTVRPYLLLQVQPRRLLVSRLRL